MAGTDPVFVVWVHARNGMEHLGTNTDICQAGVQFFLDRHRSSGPVGARWLLALAVVYVANGQKG